MKTSRFYTAMIVLLVLINLTTLGFLWFNRPPGPPPHPGERPGVAYEIGLSGAAKTRVEKLEKQHHKDKRALMEKDRALHKAYFDLVGSGGNSDSLLNLIQSNKREIESMTFAFFDEVARECTDEQKVALREFISLRLREISGGPGGPPHHPPGK